MKNKVLTIITATVTKDQWDLLKEKYEAVDKKDLPSSLLNSYLIQDSKEPEIWRIVTVWENLEAMSQYRQSVETPAWILVFQAVNADPELTINEIILSK
jgi:quinol monooxygenase YgiN